MIKAIIFDWGGVLIDNPTEDLMKYCAKELNINVQIFKNEFSKYEDLFQKGQIYENELWNQICDKLNIKKPKVVSLWKEAVKNIFKDKTETYNLIKKLKNNGYKIGFLSNTEIPAMEYFLEKGYEKYFDVVVFSCAEKIAKPDEKIYQIVLKKLNIKPKEAIFIDDKPKYIQGAVNIGINGIVFDTTEQLLKELKSFSINLAEIRTKPQK